MNIFARYVEARDRGVSGEKVLSLLEPAIGLKGPREWYGGSANDPSNVEDEGDGGDGVSSRMVKPGAFPAYGDDLPITDRNRRSRRKFMSKDGKKKK